MMMMTQIATGNLRPDTNPKSAVGQLKAPLRLVPPVVIARIAEAFNDGAIKYGPFNWRDNGVAVSVYYEAAMRHLGYYWDGEDLASDSRVRHLAHAAACLAIIMDAESIGMLIDDRPTKGAMAKTCDEIWEINKEKASALVPNEGVTTGCGVSGNCGVATSCGSPYTT